MHNNADAKKNCKSFIQKSLTFAEENGQKVQEDVDVSVKGNFVQYHLENNGTEVWVINDFNTVSNQYNYKERTKHKLTNSCFELIKLLHW